jgi:hypothetical protein
MGLLCFAAGLLQRRKLLCHDIPALGLGFVGGLNTVPELVLQVCHSCCLSYLQVIFHSPQGEDRGVLQAVSVCLFDQIIAS